MTVGVFAVGLAIILTAVQFKMIVQLRANTSVSTRQFWTMIAIAATLPLTTYLIFYAWFPQFGEVLF